ncbi:MAG: DUF6502 family protein [Steroidobacteraceae bacterium]
MQSDFRAALVRLCYRILWPLVRILIGSGVSAGEFKSIVDSVYARAGREYLERTTGQPTNSRLAVITGINRSALNAIMRAPPIDDFRPRSGTQLHRAQRVLSGWHDDAQFQTRSGGPAVLPIIEGSQSFRELALQYSGGVYYHTILLELERLGAVKRTDGDRVRVLRRSLYAGGPSAASVLAASEVAGDLMTTLERNLAAEPDEQLPVRSLVLRADARSLPLFRAQVGRRADALIEQVDSFLQTHGARAAGRATRGSRASRTPHGEAQPEGLLLGATVFAVCRSDEPAAARPKRRRNGTSS